MNILHLASFTGNIGDNASHAGLKTILNSTLNKYCVTQLEIRKFYTYYRLQDKRSFDSDFISYANTFDLLIIGGGGFLDYCVEGSNSGTTINITPELINKITVPTLIVSVGCTARRKVPEGNIKKVKAFLDSSLNNPKIKIAIRNDGSVDSFKQVLGNKYLEEIPEILDFGFFYASTTTAKLPVGKPFVSVNITFDQIRSYTSKIDINLYHAELLKVMKYLCFTKHLNIILIPHIYSDLVAITELFQQMDDYIIREFFTVAPCIQSAKGADYLFSLYNQSELVVGTRFHSNVCSLAMNKITIGLAALDRVKYVYNQFGLNNSFITLDGCFSKDLINKINYVNDNTTSIQKQIKKKLNYLKPKSLNTLKTLFNDLNL